MCDFFMENVNFEDFAKLDLRVGLIKSVEEHPNADRLFVLKVDLGEEDERTICAGIKAFYSKEELEGKQAVFVANLEKKMLRGVESQGMILAAGDSGKSKVVFVKPEKDMNPGDKIS
ncbi:MAG: methionine--tRNA ligase subunit beta [Nanoarchaeota archaeon]|nr:methionine--tRNA ligase subunit beta [Nanoarchaeota archaeon]